MASSTSRRLFSDTGRVPLIAWDTVVIESPVMRAISRMLTPFLPLPAQAFSVPNVFAQTFGIRIYLTRFRGSLSPDSLHKNPGGLLAETPESGGFRMVKGPAFRMERRAFSVGAT